MPLVSATAKQPFKYKKMGLGTIFLFEITDESWLNKYFVRLMREIKII